MTLPKVLVTGATGKIGAAVVARLHGEGWPVRGMVHMRDDRSGHLERLGIEVAVADLFDPNQLLEALRGTARAFFIPPFNPYAIQAAAAFSAAARGAGLEAIVGLSQWLASPAHPALLTRQHWLIDQMFAALPGIAHTTLNPGYFADNYLRLLDFAAIMGVFPVLTGASRNAPPANEDIARVAAAVLMDPGRHAGKSYRPTGPKLLSAYEMAPIIGAAVGRRVRAFDMPWWMFERAARLQGEPPYTLGLLKHYVEEHKRGTFECGAPTDVVREVTGTPAEDFAATARRYAAMPFAQRTSVNRARVIGIVMRVPVTPGLNLARMERVLAAPAPPEPRYSMDDPGWMLEHTAQVAEADARSSAIPAGTAA